MDGENVYAYGRAVEGWLLVLLQVAKQTNSDLWTLCRPNPHLDARYGSSPLDEL